MKPGDLVDITIRVRLVEKDCYGIYFTPEVGGYTRCVQAHLVRKMRRVRVRGKSRSGEGA